MPIQPRLFQRSILQKHSKPMMRQWHLFDANKQVVGRMAQDIATLLSGKHKPTFQNSVDDGDTIVVVNIEKMEFTGKKWKQKLYYKHSGYPGGLKKLTAEQVRARDPARILREAVKGMLPKDLLRRDRITRLKVYEGPDHPHFQQFKIDVKKEDEVQEVIIPELPNKDHQALMDYYRAHGDDGMHIGLPKGIKIVHEVDLKKEKALAEGKEEK